MDKKSGVVIDTINPSTWDTEELFEFLASQGYISEALSQKNIFHILYNGILFGAIENEIMKLVELENFTLRAVPQAQKGKFCVLSFVHKSLCI